MLRKLLVAAIVLAMAIPAFAVDSRIDIDVQNHAINPVGPQAGDRADVEFNTGGAYNTPCDVLGSATGWAYYSVHYYTNTGGQALVLLELGFPTCENSSDPIELPVVWLVQMDMADINIVNEPGNHAWSFQGTFTPTNQRDSEATALVYDAIDVVGENIVLAVGETMIWGYENAGLQGMLSSVVEQTWGFYVDFWDDDVLYGRTTLMQFMGDYVPTAAEESSISLVKSFY